MSLSLLLVACDSDGEVIEGDSSAIWYSRWLDVPDPTHSHHLTVEMGEEALSLEGPEFMQRQDGRCNLREVKAELSTDGERWKEVYTGELENMSPA